MDGKMGDWGVSVWLYWDGRLRCGGRGGQRGRYQGYCYAGTTKMIPAVLRLGNDESHFDVSLIVRDKVTNKTVTIGPRLESPSALFSLQTLWNCDTMIHTSSIAFRHLTPNSARFIYATEGARTLYLRAAVHRRGQRPPKGLVLVLIRL